MPPRSTSTVARPWLPSKKQVAGRPVRCRSGSTNPSRRARSPPISHSASSRSWCALAWTRWPDVRLMRERTSATTSSARWWWRVIASSSRSATTSVERGQLLGHAAAARDRIRRPSAMSLRLVRRPWRPPRRRSSANTSTTAPIAASTQTQAAVPEPGAAAAEEGRAAAARAAAPSAHARGTRGLRSCWGRPAAGHDRSVGARRAALVPSLEGFDARWPLVAILANETLMF